MFTRDRVNRLLTIRGFEELPCGPVKLHDTLDLLDDLTGINTTGGLQYGVLSCKLVPINSVGQRVKAHEILVAKPPPLLDDCCTCGHC